MLRLHNRKLKAHENKTFEFDQIKVKREILFVFFAHFFPFEASFYAGIELLILMPSIPTVNITI